MNIEQLELNIFRDLDDLKNYIKQNFNVLEMQDIEHDDDYDLDDELGFCDDKYDYSVYYMVGKSGRIIVVETGKSPY